MKRTILAAVLAAATVVLVACGGSGKKTTSTAAPTTPAQAPAQTQAPASHSVAISADPGGALSFTTRTATAKAGAVTLKFTNPSSVPHGLSLEGGGANVNGKVIDGGQSATVTVNLKPGTYTYFCPVPGHRAAGMEGTLTVR